MFAMLAVTSFWRVVTRSMYFSSCCETRSSIRGEQSTKHANSSRENACGSLEVNELLRRSRLRVHGRVCAFHFGCNLARSANLNQIAFADAGALVLFANPGDAVFHEFRPKRIEAALSRLYGVDAAATVLQEMALARTRFPETEQMPVADDVLRLEGGRGHVDK